MTDETSESGAVAAVETAIDNAEGEAHAEGLALGLEIARERIDQAQEDAMRIAEAAVATEIGRRVAELEEVVSTWLGTTETGAAGGRVVALENRLAMLEEENRHLRDRLASLETPAEPAPVLIPVSTGETVSSIPQALAGEMAAEADPMEMETPPAAAVVVPVVAPQARERRKVKLL